MLLLESEEVVFRRRGGQAVRIAKIPAQSLPPPPSLLILCLRFFP